MGARLLRGAAHRPAAPGNYLIAIRNCVALQAEDGRVDCKQSFASNLNRSPEPFRARRSQIARDPDYVWDVLRDGDRRARVIAEETMAAVHQTVGLP